MDGLGHTDLEVEATRLVGLGEVLSCAGLEQCVELEVVLAYASLKYLENVSRRRKYLEELFVFGLCLELLGVGDGFLEGG